MDQPLKTRIEQVILACRNIDDARRAPGGAVQRGQRQAPRFGPSQQDEMSQITSASLMQGRQGHPCAQRMRDHVQASALRAQDPRKLGQSRPRPRGIGMGLPQIAPGMPTEGNRQTPPPIQAQVPGPTDCLGIRNIGIQRKDVSVGAVPPQSGRKTIAMHQGDHRRTLGRGVQGPEQSVVI